MSQHCPTCGQPLSLTLDADALLSVLQHGQPHRMVYLGRDGLWYVTYGGGRVGVEAVQELVRRRAIQSVYSNCPSESYHVGQTIDVDATTERRKREGRKAPLVYSNLVSVEGA